MNLYLELDNTPTSALACVEGGGLQPWENDMIYTLPINMARNEGQPTQINLIYDGFTFALVRDQMGFDCR